MTAPLNLTRLAHFVAVADAGGMTQAASELLLTQQAVSSSIRQLERELGVDLFHRSGRRLELTRAGRELREGSTTLLSAARRLVETTVGASRNAPRTYRVGHTPAITSDEVFLLLEPIREAMSDTPIEVHETFPSDLTLSLLDARLDLGLRRGVVPPTQLAGTVISHDTLNAAVVSDHPLAGHGSVPMSDLARFPLMVWAPPGASFYTDHLTSVCRRAGFEPTVRVSRTQGTTPATAVVGSDCFAFVTQAPGTALGGRVTIMPIDDAPSSPVQAIWLPHTVSRPREVLIGEGAADLA
ncbi:LysR family transcriptional regulator [Williamsia sterculiae]|uniref:DNA-binding transcriptional regulator, LysR family n=1 Tax=Williamsia sterculiae TaxID=1344003 RepID=A0A1N7FJ87_9NOCA|nr:LysR family transcriptional regulator [Williamsia sterculiae]SIS00357.1 DNA-binding transcriptional regulator, LysR family [Williamsia sterculiae]